MRGPLLTGALRVTPTPPVAGLSGRGSLGQFARVGTAAGLPVRQGDAVLIHHCIANPQGIALETQSRKPLELNHSKLIQKKQFFF